MADLQFISEIMESDNSLCYDLWEMWPKPGLGQIYYAFQESVLLLVFRDHHGNHIPFYDLKGMEYAMLDNECLNRFGSASAKEKFICEWIRIKEKLGWKSNDMESLESLEEFETGYDLPRLTPDEFKDALRQQKTEDLPESAIELIKRFVEMYSIVEAEKHSDSDELDNY